MTFVYTDNEKKVIKSRLQDAVTLLSDIKAAKTDLQEIAKSVKEAHNISPKAFNKLAKILADSELRQKQKEEFNLIEDLMDALYKDDEDLD